LFAEVVGRRLDLVKTVGDALLIVECHAVTLIDRRQKRSVNVASEDIAHSEARYQRVATAVALDIERVLVSVWLPDGRAFSIASLGHGLVEALGPWYAANELPLSS
jgi:hypothetical protein